MPSLEAMCKASNLLGRTEYLSKNYPEQTAYELICELTLLVKSLQMEVLQLERRLDEKEPHS